MRLRPGLASHVDLVHRVLEPRRLPHRSTAGTGERSAAETNASIGKDIGAMARLSIHAAPRLTYIAPVHVVVELELWLCPRLVAPQRVGGVGQRLGAQAWVQRRGGRSNQVQAPNPLQQRLDILRLSQRQVYTQQAQSHHTWFSSVQGGSFPDACTSHVSYGHASCSRQIGT